MAAYKNNLGMMEMIQLQEKATDAQLKQLDRIVEKEDWKAYQELTAKVLKVNLQ